MMTVVNIKRLEAAHHNWQRRILGDTRRDKIRNEEIRRRTRMETMEVSLTKIRLQWIGHVHQLDDKDGKRGPERPRKS